MLERRALLTGLVAATAAPWSRAAAQGKRRAPILVIVGPSVQLEELSLAKLRSLYLGMPANDPAGTRLAPLNQPPGTPVRVAFDRLVLGMAPEEVSRFWIDRRMRGHGLPPRAVDSQSLLQRLVVRVPGLVAYVRKEPLLPQLRALRIDGRAADDPAYRLFVEE